MFTFTCLNYVATIDILHLHAKYDSSFCWRSKVSSETDNTIKLNDTVTPG